ncbi:MAG: hypothetical protein EOO89_10650 [Pedobacter sp.]|nr:MAG: hypothetical protein EOO89_10650 [Pedobacter sp.]
MRALYLIVFLSASFYHNAFASGNGMLNVSKETFLREKRASASDNLKKDGSGPSENLNKDTLPSNGAKLHFSVFIPSEPVFYKKPSRERNAMAPGTGSMSARREINELLYTTHFFW